jgi:carbon monoxide dehydrogenase subunit G
MKLESSFSVRAPIDEVWAALLDVERTAPCLPGARVLERRGDDVYGLALDVALGENPVSCQGEVAIVEREPGERRAVLNLTAESDGDGRAVALVELSLVADGELTAGAISGELSLSGGAAAVDPATIEVTVERLVDGFARNLAAMLGGGVPTVNGADPASSTARTPAPVGDPLPGDSRIVVGPAAPAAAQAPPEPLAETPAAATAADPGVVPPPEPPPSPGAGSWAGAPRQTGAIERLRTPLGAVLVGLAILAVLWRRTRRRGRGAGDADATPAGGSAA